MRFTVLAMPVMAATLAVAYESAHDEYTWVQGSAPRVAVKAAADGDVSEPSTREALLENAYRVYNLMMEAKPKSADDAADEDVDDEATTTTTVAATTTSVAPVEASSTTLRKVTPTKKKTTKIVKKPVKKTTKKKKVVKKPAKKVRGHKRDALPATSSAPPPTATCAAQTIPWSYKPNPNTEIEFSASVALDTFAKNQTTPAGYTRRFVAKTATLNQAGFIGYRGLATYDVNACAAFCTGEPTCTSFTLFAERVPTLDPAPVTCNNPAAGVGVGCTLYSTAQNITNLVNIGQWRTDFMLLIAASNGYDKTS